MKIIQTTNSALTNPEKDYTNPLVIMLAKEFNNLLNANPYELYLIEEEDWTLSKNQAYNFILFRSDTRSPDEIFNIGFNPKAEIIVPGQPTSEGKIQVCMRKMTKTGQIDIAPHSGVSVTEQAKIAPYFPYDNVNGGALGKRYVYAIYVDKFFKAHEYELKNNDPATAAFKEAVCAQVPAKYVIGAFECEVIDRKETTTTRYKLKKQSLIWNNKAVVEVPYYDAKKLAMQNEFEKLVKYNFLELKVDSVENLIRVQGNTTIKKVDNTNIVYGAKPISTPAMFKNVPHITETSTEHRAHAEVSGSNIIFQGPCKSPEP